MQKHYQPCISHDAASDILSFPSQPGAVDILYSPDMGGDNKEKGGVYNPHEGYENGWRKLIAVKRGRFCCE